MSEAYLYGEVHQGSIQVYGSTILTGSKRQVMQDALMCRADVSLFQSGTKRVDLMGQDGHEPFAARGIAAEGCQHFALRVDTHT